MPGDGRPRVLILGGGFAGVGAAQKLQKAEADVVLVDRHDYHTFQPLLYQLATGLLDTTAVGHSLRDLLSRHENTVIHKARVSPSGWTRATRISWCSRGIRTPTWPGVASPSSR